MTKDVYLKSLLVKKKSWQYSMPIFEQSNILVSVKSDTLFESTLPIIAQEGALFECYCESLKNIVRVKSCWISSSEPYIDYFIEPRDLVEGYLYEDQLNIYYAGGLTKISFQIEKKSEIMNSETELIRNTSSQLSADRSNDEHNRITQGIIHEDKDKKVTHIDPIEVSGLKRTYHPKETIQINVRSRIPKQTPITFIMSNDWIVPNRLELYLHEHWTQEWYVKKNSIEQVLSKWIGKHEQEKEVVLTIYVGDNREHLKTYSLIISPYEPYLTSIRITNEKDFRRLRIECLKTFRNRQMKNMDMRNIKEKFMACLNFDQQDLPFRIFYILFLLGYESRKSARDEYGKLIRNTGRTEILTYNYALTGLEALISGSKESIEDFLQSNYHEKNWMLAIIKLHAIEAIKHDFSSYETLYQQGYDSCFLIARCVDHLNNLPVLPKADLKFYITCLQWALSHDCISKEWLGKLEKYYYLFEKEDAFNYHITIALYNKLSSLFFLRLVCAKSIAEEIVTRESHDLYLRAYHNKLYIQKLEQAYIEVCYALKIPPQLEYVTYRSSFADGIKEFLFVEIIKERLAYPLVYRRIYKEVVAYLSDKSKYTSETFHIIRLLFHELIEENSEFMRKLFQKDHILMMYIDLYGLELLNAMLHLCLTVNKYISLEDSEDFIKVFIDTIGFEGVVKCYGNPDIIYRFVMMSEKYSLHDMRFLPNSLYIKKIPQEAIHIDLLIKLLCDASINEVIKLYEMILYEKEFEGLDTLLIESIQEPFFDYLGSKIVNDHYEIQKPLFIMLYEYAFANLPIRPGYIFALIKSLYHLEKIDDNITQKIYAAAKKHDIILPWEKNNKGYDRKLLIEFLASENDQIIIHYRYPSDHQFISEPMRHIGFGTFLFPIQLFYGEIFEYYIEQRFHGQIQIPISEIIEKDSVAYERVSLDDTIEQNSDGNFNINITSYLDQIAQSFELDDYQSGRSLEEEIRDHIIRMVKIPRI